MVITSINSIWNARPQMFPHINKFLLVCKEQIKTLRSSRCVCRFYFITKQEFWNYLMIFILTQRNPFVHYRKIYCWLDNAWNFSSELCNLFKKKLLCKLKTNLSQEKIFLKKIWIIIESYSFLDLRGLRIFKEDLSVSERDQRTLASSWLQVLKYGWKFS